MAFALSIKPKFRPREPRKSVRLGTQILLADDREVTIMVTNISRAGFTARFDEALEAGTCLGISLPGCGIRRAEVRWSEEREFGARFESELTEAQLSAISAA